MPLARVCRLFKPGMSVSHCKSDASVKLFYTIPLTQTCRSPTTRLRVFGSIGSAWGVVMAYLRSFLIAGIAWPVLVATVVAQPTVPSTAPVTEPPASAAAAPAGQPMSPASQTASREGLAHLKEKKYKEAVNSFMIAAKASPKNGELRNMLGTALAQDKQLGQAWLQFRRAVLLDPTHKPGVKNFATMWNAFHLQGVDNAGRKKQNIAKLLGEPDGKSGTAEREVWQYGYMRLQFLQDALSVVIDPRGVNPAALRPSEVMQIDFDDKTRWRLGYRVINRFESRSQYVPDKQSVQKWEELYTVQRLHGLATRKTLQEMMTQIREALQKANPDIKFQALANDQRDVMFYTQTPGSKDAPSEYEIVRLVAGKEDVHRLAYTRKAESLPRELAQQWIDLLGKAKLSVRSGSPAAAGSN